MERDAMRHRRPGDEIAHVPAFAPAQLSAGISPPRRCAACKVTLPLTTDIRRRGRTSLLPLDTPTTFVRRSRASRTILRETSDRTYTRPLWLTPFCNLGASSSSSSSSPPDRPQPGESRYRGGGSVPPASGHADSLASPASDDSEAKPPDESNRSISRAVGNSRNVASSMGTWASSVLKPGTAPNEADDSSELTGSLPPAETSSSSTSRGAALSAKRSVQRRVATGFAMGFVVIALIFSGKVPFLMLMLCGQLLGQAEYYRMVNAKGHAPAVKCGLVCTATLLLITAFAPHLADAVFPVGGTFICIYLLFRQRKIATIADISTTFMGLFYAGYLPSFWLRLHNYSPVSESMAAAATTPLGGLLSKMWPNSLLPVTPMIELGPMLVFWTWLSGASADIAAFFAGRAYGTTRFTSISPKKTVEGAIAGFVCSASVSMLGAFLMRWPLWYITGMLYGVTVAVVGLCGDLIASSFKRDVGWKDSGQLFPGHGGILDRADSYVLIAPLVYYFTTLALPLLRGV